MTEIRKGQWQHTTHRRSLIILPGWSTHLITFSWLSCRTWKKTITIPPNKPQKNSFTLRIAGWLICIVLLNCSFWINFLYFTKSIWFMLLPLPLGSWVVTCLPIHAFTFTCTKIVKELCDCSEHFATVQLKFNLKRDVFVFQKLMTIFSS